jgi:hypothetical protein
VAKAHRGSGVYSQLRELSVAKRDYPSIGFPNEISRRITKTYPGDVRVYHSIDEWWYPLIIGNRNGSLPFLIDTLSSLYTFLWLGKAQTAAHGAAQRFKKLHLSGFYPRRPFSKFWVALHR